MSLALSASVEMMAALLKACDKAPKGWRARTESYEVVYGVARWRVFYYRGPFRLDRIVIGSTTCWVLTKDADEGENHVGDFWKRADALRFIREQEAAG